MDLQRYQTNEGSRIALIVSEGRKWMKLAVIEGGRLQIIKRPNAEQRFMSIIEWNRHSKASIRRLARKSGTPKSIRAAIKLIN